MAQAKTLKAERARREKEKAAALAAADPSKLTWEEFKNKLREQKGSALSPTNLAKAKEEWDAANPKPVEPTPPPKEVKKPTVSTTSTTTSTTSTSPGLGNVNAAAGTLTPSASTVSGTASGGTYGSGKVRYILDLGNGNYQVADSDNQTRNNVTQKEALALAKDNGIKIFPTGSNPGSAESTGFNNNAGSSFPGTTGYVMLPDKDGKTLVKTSISDAYNYGYSNLGALRKTLLNAQQLTKSEASDPTKLLSKWAEILTGASLNPNYSNPFDYANYLKSQGFTSSASAGQQTPYTTVSSKDEALNAINAAFDKQYHRLPTDAEVKSWTKKLNAAQIANPSKPVMVNGVMQYQGGLGSPDLWVANQLINTPEYKNVQGRVNSLAAQSLQSAAADNGVTLTPTQISDFTNRLAHGENIDTIKSTIRDIAALGQPDSIKNLLKQGNDLATIYSPYKQVMANTLEINPATITLNDPTLRSAITKDGEMSLYDYQNALRKDPRWQYTNNARTAVADSVSQVLKDFGFMG